MPSRLVAAPQIDLCRKPGTNIAGDWEGEVEQALLQIILADTGREWQRGTYEKGGLAAGLLPNNDELTIGELKTNSSELFDLVVPVAVILC